MESGRVVNGEAQSTVVNNAGRAEEFILCCLRQLRKPVEVSLLGSDIIQTRMHATGVVPLKVVSDVGARGAHAVIGFEVNPFVLHAAPETFNKDVVAPGAAPVHRQLAALGEHRVGEFGGRELAALIGVDDLGRAVAGEGLLDDLSGVTGLQRDGYLVREHAAAGDIHHGGEVDEA